MPTRGPNDPISLPASSFLLPDLETKIAEAIAGDDAGRYDRVNAALDLARGYATSQGVWYPKPVVPIPAPTAPSTIFNATTSTTGWSAVSGGVLANEAGTHPSGQTDFLTITCAQADTFAGGRTTTVPGGKRLADLPIVGLWADTAMTQGSIALRFTSDNFASKTKTFSWPAPGQIHSGWNLLTVRPDDAGLTSPNGGTWTVAGGFADTDVINGVEIQITTNGGVATKIRLGGVVGWSQVPTIGCVRFGFDKFGEASIPKYALPILWNAGITGYWAGDGDLIQNPGNPRSYLQQVYRAGWPVISQGMNHLSYVTQGAAVLETDYLAAKAIFTALGLTRGSSLFSYPLSANNDATDAKLAELGVIASRSGWGWDIKPNQWNAGPKLIGHGAVNIGNLTLTQAKRLIDRAELYGVDIDLFCHGLVPGGTGGALNGDPLYWYVNDYIALGAYAAAQRDAGKIRIEDPVRALQARGVLAY
jgi:hypothetical protein